MRHAPADVLIEPAHAGPSAAARDIHLLAGVPAATQERVLAHAKVERLQARELLFSEGEIPEAKALEMAKAYLHDTAVSLYPGKVH